MEHRKTPLRKISFNQLSLFYRAPENSPNQGNKMTKSSPSFFYLLLKQVDPYIKLLGDDGFDKFYKNSKNTLNDKAFNKLWRRYIKTIEEDGTQSYLYTRFLIGAYIKHEKNKTTPAFLKNWIITKLTAIYEGENAEKAFGLIAPKGKKKSKPMHNQLMIITLYHLKIRQGLKHKEAIEQCSEEKKITKRAIYKFLQGIEDMEDIDTKTLDFFSRNDISHLYS